MKTKECDHEVDFIPSDKKFQCMICGRNSPIKIDPNFMEVFFRGMIQIDDKWSFWRVWRLLGDTKGWRKGLFESEIIHDRSSTWFYLECDCRYLRQIGSYHTLYDTGFFAWWAFQWRCRKIRKHLEE